ncbi:hypothetical protein GTO10_03125, partial [Candidatus Saccharibacteria bacterium]|nr:hypothetical protein [Candidatus Saccharibacteria bacterium]
MTEDLRQQALHHAVAELIVFETDLETTLKGEQQAIRGHSDAAATIERFAPMVQTQRDRLADYLKTLGAASAGGKSAAGFPFSPASTASSALRQISVAF